MNRWMWAIVLTGCVSSQLDALRQEDVQVTASGYGGGSTASELLDRGPDLWEDLLPRVWDEEVLDQATRYRSLLIASWHKRRLHPEAWRATEERERQAFWGVEACLRSEHRVLRVAAAGALGRSGDLRAFRPLVDQVQRLDRRDDAVWDASMQSAAEGLERWGIAQRARLTLSSGSLHVGWAAFEEWWVRARDKYRRGEFAAVAQSLAAMERELELR